MFCYIILFTFVGNVMLHFLFTFVRDVLLHIILFTFDDIALLPVLGVDGLGAELVPLLPRVVEQENHPAYSFSI